MTKVVSPAEPDTSTLPWVGRNGDQGNRPRRAALTETSIDLPQVRDLPGADLTATSLELTPVRDEPAAGLSDTALDLPRVPDAPAAGLSDTALDLTPVRDAPLPGLADTSLDLTPVRDLPARDEAPHGGARAIRPSVKAPGPPRGRPHEVRLRPGGGAHAGRAPVRTPERAGRLADPRRLAAQPRLTTLPAAPLRQAPRSAAGAVMAGLVVATAVPLCLLQVPFAPLTGTGASATQSAAETAGTMGALGPSAVLRAASLALPFAVAAAPLAALAVRRMRGWPVLLAGLIVIVAGNVLTAAGGATATATASGALAAVVGALHGIGAGLAIPATVALVTEHAGLPRRLLAAWWAAATVAALAVTPAVSPGRHAGGWLATLGPVPWLTMAALAAALLYPLLSGGPSQVARREDRRATTGRSPAARAERARLTLLAPAAAALGVIAVAATYRPGDTIVVAAIWGAAGLLVMAAMALLGTAGDAFAIGCVVAGLSLAPASAALAGLRAMASAPGVPAGTVAPGTLLAAAAVAGAAAGAAAAVAGAAAGAATARKGGRAPGASLLLAAAALVAASFAGPYAAPAVLAVLVAAVTCGLTAALARAAGQVTTAGAMTGVILLAGGALAGYLAAGAVRVKLAGTALAPAVTAASPGHLNRIGVITAGSAAGPADGPAAVPHSLVTALGWQELACAAVAIMAVIVVNSRRARAGAPARRAPRHVARPAPRAASRQGLPAEQASGSAAAEQAARGGRGRGRIRPAHG